jgi:HAMP domain-containing protein
MSEPAKATARSPFAGCAILITVVLMVVFLIVFSTVTLFRQAREIEKFTSDQPVAIEVTPVENRETELNALAEKLETFRQNLIDEKDAELRLSADDLNFAIAAYEPLKDLRGTFRVLNIENGALRIAVSYQMNGRPRLAREGETGWITSDFRYLNATLLAEPHVFENEVALKLNAIEVPGATVPREFIEQMSPYRIAERYTTHPVLGPAMKNLTGVEIIDHTLVFRRKSGESVANSITNDQVDTATSRLFFFFGIGATVFLIFAGIVIFLSLRAKRSGV